MKYTPCLAWPECSSGERCAFKHPALLQSPCLEFMDVIAPPQSLVQATRNLASPYGSHQLNGTTYFPILPSPVVHIPQAYESACTAQNSIHERSEREASLSGAISLEENRSPSWSLADPEDARHPGLSSEAAGVTGTSEADTDRLTFTAEDEFPFRPPKNQRVGHARRISVAIKVRDDSSTKDIINEPDNTAKRMTHQNRKNRQVRMFC